MWAGAVERVLCPSRMWHPSPRESMKAARGTVPSPQGREDDQEKPWATSPFPGLYFCVWHNIATWFHPKENQKDSAEHVAQPHRVSPG